MPEEVDPSLPPLTPDPGEECFIPPSERPKPAPKPAEAASANIDGMATLTLRVGKRILFEQSDILDFVGVIEVANKGVMVLPSPSLPWWSWAVTQLDFELTSRIAGAKMEAIKKQQSRGIVMASEVPKGMLGRKP